MQVEEQTMKITAEFEAELKETARKLRVEVIKMLARAGSGHPGGSLGMADIFTCLYWGGFVKHDPKNPGWVERDRVVLSNGHICPILYAVLAERGYFPHEWLNDLRQLGARTARRVRRRAQPRDQRRLGTLGQQRRLDPQRGSDAEVKNLVLTFDGDQLASIEGDYFPEQDEALVRRLAKQRYVNLPREEKNKRRAGR